MWRSQHDASDDQINLLPIGIELRTHNTWGKYTGKEYKKSVFPLSPQSKKKYLMRFFSVKCHSQVFPSPLFVCCLAQTSGKIFAIKLKIRDVQPQALLFLFKKKWDELEKNKRKDKRQPSFLCKIYHKQYFWKVSWSIPERCFGTNIDVIKSLSYDLFINFNNEHLTF